MGDQESIGHLRPGLYRKGDVIIREISLGRNDAIFLLGGLFSVCL